ncbi:MAG: DUF1254 domain-containing protein [Rhodospirillales bacterium]|nr:DUF1254 domain-containing protein [Rhodospirillales bacterium]
MSSNTNSSGFRCIVGLAAGLAFVSSAAVAQVTATPAEARKVSGEAYLYGFPVVDSYKTQYAQAIEVGGPDYKAPFNQIGNTANVFTPDDKAIITPNSDTPYSFVWMDLRAEPIVLTLPKIDPKRYYSVQLIDVYTHNFAYLGRRTTGSGGGSFLIAGPSWKGATPTGITKAIRSETEIVYALYRTQLFNDRDLDEVRKVQAGYKVQPLSAFAGTPAPKPAPTVDWPKPEADMLDSLSLFKYLDFMLQFAPTHPSEKALMQRFAKIGVGPGKPFDVAALSPDMKAALEVGIADGKQQFAEFKKTQIDTHKVDSLRLFGTREELKNNYMYRFAGARLGIYGNSGSEAIYVGGFVDADGQPVDASKHRYVMRFPKGGLPPNDAFWSLTMYDGKTQLLVANPLKRYLINSSMEPQLKLDANGGVTLYVQAEPPSTDKEANWLPAPKGPFYTVLRIYQPKPEVQSGKWKAPPLRKAD